MGEQVQFQPLTKEDKISVVLYRTGIVLSVTVLSLFAYMLYNASFFKSHKAFELTFNVLMIVLSVSVGLSVFCIHLYVRRFHKTLKKMYVLSIACLAGLYYLGKGDAFSVLAGEAYGPLLLLPMAGCLGFITAKEAFCFRLTEGYLIAMLMPLLILAYATGQMSITMAAYGLIALSGLLVFFTFRKVFQPIHFDIGDKSAYQ